MSRSQVAKSRAEKAGKASTAPTPAITQEIVPGKYNDHDWNLMLDHDDGDDFVFDIVDSICNSAQDVIFREYIQRQLVPYTVSQAKDAILQIIEWQFLARDEGESDVQDESGWVEDEEPEPGMTDCWAQGSVPRQLVTPRAASRRMPTFEEDEEPSPTSLEQEPQLQSSETNPEVEAEQEEQQHSQQESKRKDEEEEEEKMDEEEEEGEEDSIPVEESTLPEEDNIELESEESKPDSDSMKQNTDLTTDSKKKKKKIKRHFGRLPSAGVSKMTESLEQWEMQHLTNQRSPSPAKSPDPAMLQMPASCHSILKLQNGRPPGNRDVLYDESGNVISVTKLDPSQLPSHKVKTGFHVVDPAAEAAKAQLEAMRTGRYLKRTNVVAKPDNSPRSTLSRTTTVGKGTDRSHGTSVSYRPDYGKSKAGINPLPAPLIESMEVSAGVVVREGERVKHGARQNSQKASVSQQKLRPLAIRATIPKLTVAELLEHQTPVLKPLVDSPPIPPISASRISSQ